MNETIDRISSLPDDVVTHILSFTSTKEAVQTCILAKRWRNIWASVPVLNFYLDEFWKTNDEQEDDENGDSGDGGGGDDDDEYEQRICEERFEHFVDGVLENRGPSHVNRVTFSWRYESFYGYSPFNTYGTYMDFLDRIVLLMPREIVAYIDTSTSLLVPDSVFSCALLQKLMMHLYNDDYKVMLAPNSINLPSLKTLELKCLVICDNFVRNLFLGCPALESIKLDFCDLDIPVISSSVLKMLTLHECMPCQPLRISCPALISLSIDSVIQEEGNISSRNMTSLVNADIKIFARDYSLQFPILNFLSGLSNATSLKLHVHGHELEEQWDEGIPHCRTFSNLKSLDIGMQDMISNFDLVACFLKNSPNLRELTLRPQYSLFDAHEESLQKVLGDRLFHIDYLETLKIYGHLKFARSLVKLLHRCIKTIGNIIY